MVAARQRVVIFLLVIAAALTNTNTVRAAAGGPQICYTSSSCTLGEFLFDDEYQPITTATCNLTSKYPDGSAHLTNQQMSVRDDGWYYHSFTTPTTTGYYTAQICCTAGEDYLCLDKSFEVKETEATPTPQPTPPSANDIASAVWGYSGRTLTSFGTLVSDIWSSSTRTLSSFGDLISGIWSASSRTLTSSSLSSGNLATKSDVEKIGNISNINNFVATAGGELATIKKKVEENRLLLERVVNKPIIESTFEEIDDKDLSEKISQSKSLTSQIYISNQFLFSKTASLVSKWNSLTDREVLDVLIEMDEVLGEEGEGSSFLGNISSLRQFWGWAVVDDLSEQAGAIKKTLAFIKQGISAYGKTPTLLRETKSLLAYLKTSQKIIGESTDKQPAKSLYAKINTTESFALALEERLAEAQEYLKEVANPTPGLKTKTEEFLRRVLALNQLPRVKGIFQSANWAKEKQVKNQLLAARGLLLANRRLLVNGETKPLAAAWFEEGSIIVKILISNPSTLISQEVPLKFYLPEEIKSETDIISVDDGVAVKFDAEKNRYCIEGNFTLKPGETKTVSVRLKDDWEIPPQQIESLRKQAEELSRPLEKTAYFAQGITLKSDINASLDRAELLMKDALTPEQKIKAYRQAQIELNAVNTKMDKLKELVAAASGAGGILGFVGGSQAIAVWGIIVVVALGFIFLALSLRKIGGGMINNNQNSLAQNQPEEKIKKGKTTTQPKDEGIPPNSSVLKPRGLPKLVFPLIGAMIISSGLTTASLKLWEAKKAQPVENVKGVEDKAVGGPEIVRLTSEKGEIGLYPLPVEGEPKTALKSGVEAIKTDEQDDWIKILLVKNLSPYEIEEGWVKKEFVNAASDQEEKSPEITVTIKDTPTGWLRVRETPQGKEIGKVYPGDVYQFLSQENGWYQIKFGEQEGWISGKYATLNEEAGE